MTEFDIDKVWREQLEQRRQQREQQVRCSSAHASQLPPIEQPIPVQDAKTPGNLPIIFSIKLLVNNYLILILLIVELQTSDQSQFNLVTIIVI